MAGDRKRRSSLGRALEVFTIAYRVVFKRTGGARQDRSQPQGSIAGEQAPLFELVSQAEANGRVVKVWRSSPHCPVDGHQDADGQERFVDQAFEVGVYHMKFPGDASLGAPDSVTQQCLCGVDPVFVRRDDGLRVPIGLNLAIRESYDPAPTPTTLVTLNGRTRGRIILGDGVTFAYLRQISPSDIVVTVNRRRIATARIEGDQIKSLSIDPEFQHQGIETLLRRSVVHSAGRRW